MSGRVLVIEDDLDFRELIAEFLEIKGYEVNEAESLAEAVAQVQGGFEPGVAIIDWTLPDATGADAVAAMRNLCPSTALILATGHGAAVTKDLEGEVRTILRKPFKLTELIRWVAAE